MDDAEVLSRVTYGLYLVVPEPGQGERIYFKYSISGFFKTRKICFVL